MSTDSISGISTGYNLYGSTSQDSTGGSGINSKEAFGAAVVTSTLDALNASGPKGSTEAEQAYNFNKTVLGGHAASIGMLTNIDV